MIEKLNMPRLVLVCFSPYKMRNEKDRKLTSFPEKGDGQFIKESQDYPEKVMLSNSRYSVSSLLGQTEGRKLLYKLLALIQTDNY